MRTDRLKSLFWLVVISSWILGMVVGRWFNVDAFLGLSKAVRVTSPQQLSFWWELIAYFSLSPVAVFALSHIFFGIGGAVFLFARGIYDSSLIAYLETAIAGWSFASVPTSGVLTVLIVILILAINLPLCLWAGQLGIQRSVYTLDRLRGEPVDPEFGSEPLSNLLKIVSVSLVTGLVAALIFPYI